MVKQRLDQCLVACGALKNTDAQTPLQTNESTMSEGGASVFSNGFPVHSNAESRLRIPGLDQCQGLLRCYHFRNVLFQETWDCRSLSFTHWLGGLCGIVLLEGILFWNNFRLTRSCKDNAEGSHVPFANFTNTHAPRDRFGTGSHYLNI